MSTIVTRSGKGSPLTHTEVDNNFTNLNTDKYQEGSAIGAVTPAAGTFTTLTATGSSFLGGPTKYIGLYGSDTGTPMIQSWSTTGTGSGLIFQTRGATNYNFTTNGSTSNEQMRVSHTASAVNYVQVTGAATGAGPTISAQGSDSTLALNLQSKGTGGWTNIEQQRANYVRVQGAAVSASPILSVQGSDTNISQVFQSKGTGAIDLAAGSSGVNISNGGTVTAITTTSSGTVYTSIPSVAITAPTTAGGVQATANALMFTSTASVANGGTGYAVNDVISIVGGTYTTQGTYTVTAVSGGVITAVSRTSGSGYSVLPTSPVSTTGGSGTGATLNLLYWTVSGATITNAGSGYVEQPTVTFSGGGGSGAAAYATVGSGTVVKSIGSSLSFQIPGGGTSFKVADAGGSSNDYFAVRGSTAGNPEFYAEGSSSSISVQFLTKSTSPFRFFTRGTSYLEQFRIADTASAVNYVQVTGAATGNAPALSAQGSDTSMNFTIAAKGSGSVSLPVNRANYLTFAGTASTGGSTSISAVGSDTNIDLALTPKGTGNVSFGTYTAGVLSATGYITIKDSGGTVRRLLVG